MNLPVRHEHRGAREDLCPILDRLRRWPMKVRDVVAQRTRDNNDVVTAVGLSNVPEAIRSADTLARSDYVDCFTATAAGATDKSAEEWARALLEDTPTGRSAPSLWRLLGLRLGPTPSTDYVQGWQIAARADDWIRVEATSWCMTAHAVVRVDDGQLAVALFVRYDRRIADVIWRPVSVMHRRAVPIMLRQALKAQAAIRSDIDRRDPPMSNSSMNRSSIDGTSTCAASFQAVSMHCWPTMSCSTHQSSSRRSAARRSPSSTSRPQPRRCRARRPTRHPAWAVAASTTRSRSWPVTPPCSSSRPQCNASTSTASTSFAPRRAGSLSS